jgi:hypothetical protein
MYKYPRIKNVAPDAGFEPATYCLTGSRSTVELTGHNQNNTCIFIKAFGREEFYFHL